MRRIWILDGQVSASSSLVINPKSETDTTDLFKYTIYFDIEI